MSSDRIRAWIYSAEIESALLVVGLTPKTVDAYIGAPGLEGVQVYEGRSGRALMWESAKTRDHRDRQRHEHRELLLILQEALIKIAESDADLASKLVAKAYVNLKTDPLGQRRYDGLLHRFTGVLHRTSRVQDPPSPENPKD